MNCNELVKWLSSIIIGLVMYFTNEYGYLILLVTGAILIDIVTGLIKGKIKREINSRTGYIGLWKKIALFAGLAFGLFLDAAVQYSFIKHKGNNPLSLVQNIPFGDIIGIYIILNESISIIENLHECGVKLPYFIANTLCVSKKEIDKGGECKKQ